MFIDPVETKNIGIIFARSCHCDSMSGPDEYDIKLEDLLKSSIPRCPVCGEKFIDTTAYVIKS